VEESVFEQALVMHQSGNLAQARALYSEVLKLDPKHADSLHLIGVIHHQLGNHIEALRLIDLAICQRDVVQVFHGNRGIVLRALRLFEDALSALDRAVLLDDRYVEGFYNRGLVLSDLARWVDARESLLKAVELRPGYLKALSSLGTVCLKLELYAEARVHFSSLIAFSPNHIYGLLGRARACAGIHAYADGLKDCDVALSIDPSSPDVNNTRGNLLVGLGQFEEAIVSFDAAIEQSPLYYQAYNNKGRTLYLLDRLDEAVMQFDRSLALCPDYVDALHNRGVARQALGRFAEALLDFNCAVELKPEAADSNWNRAIALLLVGQLREGFQGYEWRWLQPAAERSASLNSTRWDGRATLRGKSLIVVAEQGFGDTIQFCRYAKLLSKLGAHVFLEVQPALGELIKSLGYPGEVFVGNTARRFDFSIPMLSLPGVLGTDLETIPGTTPYLSAHGHMVSKWATRLVDLTSYRVGLVWRGSKDHANDRNRSLSLNEILEIKQPGIDFVSLQYQVSDSEELALVNAEMFDPSGELSDFADTAALIECMDLVISVDTSVAHLAGALGKPTWVLLPFVPDWRWMLEREDSPWYPSMKLYRQPSPGDWDSVLKRVRADLTTRFGTSVIPMA
jgi:tetratricopeptide (TPR) repeat protein